MRDKATDAKQSATAIYLFKRIRRKRHRPNSAPPGWCRMIIERTQPRKYHTRTDYADQTSHSFPSEPDTMTLFTRAAALTLPEKETMVLRRRTDNTYMDGNPFRDVISRVWAHRFRLTVFAVNGMNVFALGLLIQVILVKYANMGHVLSYIVQTLVSVQISFLLSRFLTWRDRNVAILPAWGRFNVQQLAVTGLGMAGYAGLEQLGAN
jgi:hypothetical protein